MFFSSSMLKGCLHFPSAPKQQIGIPPSLADDAWLAKQSLQ
jgi:hypothetical protein